MKKLFWVLGPLLSVGIIAALVWVGFHLSDYPVTVVPETDPYSEAEPMPLKDFSDASCPTFEEAEAFLKNYNAPGYTVFNINAVYGDMDGMAVYGFFLGEDLGEDTVWSGEAQIEVHLLPDTESETPDALSSVILRISPRDCGEEAARKLLEHAGAIYTYLMPGVEDAVRQTPAAWEAYTDLYDCVLRFSDPEQPSRPEPSVKMDFLAGSRQLTFESHEAFRCVVLCLQAYPLSEP